MLWEGGCVTFVIGGGLGVDTLGRIPCRIGIFGGLGLIFLLELGGAKVAACCGEFVPNRRGE